MNATTFTLAKELERSLMILPKNCNCSVCQAQKDKVKNEMGTKKYFKVREQIGLN